uniref:Cytochrome P450 n=1 Tax=Anopheles maculatus TaxID=74869 RepID=A0A182T0V8_9DIPT
MATDVSPQNCGPALHLRNLYNNEPFNATLRRRCLKCRAASGSQTSYPFLLALNYNHLHRAAAKLTQLYNSKLVGLYLGPLPAVVVNDHDTVRQVLQCSEFDGRPDLFLARLRDEQYARRGIFFTDGDSWREQRKFFLKTLHEYGFGRRNETVEQDLQTGLTELIALLKDGPKHEHERAIVDGSTGYAVCPQMFFALFSNVLLRMLTATRLEREDQAVLFEVGKCSLAFHRQGDDYGLALSYIPWIRLLLPGFSRYRLLREVNQKANGVIRSLVEKCEQTYNEDDIRCFIDAYIREMRQTGSKPTSGGYAFGFECKRKREKRVIVRLKIANPIPLPSADDQLIIGCADFLVPAFSAIPAKLGLILERLVAHASVVEKMYTEIDRHVGQSRLPLLDDRTHLLYCEAVLREALRIDTLVPSGIPHVATTDTELAGFQIPKGTLVINGLDYINHQEEVFPEPYTFRPERFLSEEGNVSHDQDRSVPFGAGKRVCAGETFARNALFLTITTLVQQFTFTVEHSPDPEQHLTGVIRTAADFKIKFTAR